MSCPYFKEGYFGICVATDAIHVPSIEEIERFCFRAWYQTCPNITLIENPDDGENPGGARIIRRGSEQPVQECSGHKGY